MHLHCRPLLVEQELLRNKELNDLPVLCPRCCESFGIPVAHAPRSVTDQRPPRGCLPAAIQCSLPMSPGRGRPRNPVCGRCGSTPPDLLTWHIPLEIWANSCDGAGLQAEWQSAARCHLQSCYWHTCCPGGMLCAPRPTFVERGVGLLQARAHDAPLPQRLRPVPPCHVGGGGRLGERMKQRRLLHPRVFPPESCQLRPKRCSSTSGAFHIESRQPISTGVALYAVPRLANAAHQSFFNCDATRLPWWSPARPNMKQVLPTGTCVAIVRQKRARGFHQ